MFAATVLTFSLFTGVAGLSVSLGMLVGARFLTGLGLGGMVPIDQALVTEYAPAGIRGRVAAMLPMSWPMGYFCAAGAALALVPHVGWRWLIVLGFGVAGCAALAFTQATTETSLLLTAMAYAFFQDMGSLAMTVYTPEVYPVRIRGKGTALAMGWGRFGGMTSPLVAGFLIGLGSLTLVWCIISAGMLLAAGLTFLLAYETRGNLELVSRGTARPQPAQGPLQ